MPKISKQDRQLLAEYERRTAEIQVTERKPVQRQDLGFDRNLTPWQQRVIHDPSKRIHLCMGRRSGKSMCMIVMALRIVLSREDALVYFIYPSRERAKSTLWNILKRICDAYRIPAKFNESSLSVTFGTRSVACLLGVEDVYHASRLRGVVGDSYFVDEAQSFREKTLRYLLEECIEPAAADLCAPIVLAGTPSNVNKGTWFNADKRNNPRTPYSSYNATILDNPFNQIWRGQENWQQLAHEWLAEYRAKKGWSDSNPIYRREILNLWQTDSESFYYSEFKLGRNTIAPTDIPDGLSYVIGGDFGSRVDPTALVVLGYNPTLNNICYVVDCEKIESPTQAEHICARLKHLIDQYEPESVVGDYAAGGTYLFDQMRERYNVHVEDAQKRKKSGQTDVINSEFHEGHIKVSTALADNLIDELQTIHWDDERKSPLASDPNDCADAFQYGYGEVYSFLFKPSAPPKTRHELINDELNAYFQRCDDEIIQNNQNREIWGINLP